MNNEEKNIYKFMESLSGEDRLKLCEGLNLNEAENDELKKNRVKKEIMRKIKAAPASRNSRVRKCIIAAAAILILICTIIPFGGKSFADIVKKLYFIPGFGKVEQNTGQGDPLVLTQSIHYKLNQGEITIKAAIKEKNTLQVRIEGSNVTDINDFRNITIADEKGNKYVSKGGYIVCSGESVTEFMAEYWYKNIPDDLYKFNILLQKENKIQVSLVQAHSFKDYASMGPTDTENNLGITLIPSRDNDKIRFNLLQHPSDTYEISSYQKATEAGLKTEINVSDEKGKEYMVNNDQAGILSEFYFKPDSGSHKYLVEISEILLKRNKEVNKEITLPVPRKGDAGVNKQVDLNGFKLNIIKVMRVGNNLRIYLNTNYDKSKKENLSDFILADPKAMGTAGYDYMKHFSDDGYIEYYELDDINPKDKQITLKITDMYTRLKGPWKFEFTSDSLNN